MPTIKTSKMVMIKYVGTKPNQIVPTAVLDVEAAKKGFLQVATTISMVKAAANQLIVKDEESSKRALDLDSQLKKVVKELDAAMREKIADPEKFVKSVRSMASSLKEQIEEIRTTLKRKMIEYDNVLEIEKRKQQKAIEEANKKLQEELNKQAKESGVPAPTVQPVVLPPPDTTIRSESGAVGYTKLVWKYEILDPNVVARELCSPDPRKITDAIRGGLRESPGLRILEIRRGSARSLAATWKDSNKDTCLPPFSRRES